MSSADTIELFNKYVIPNYVRYPVNLVRGEGSYVWDSEGKRYLDLFPGWGCNLLGHCPDLVVEAVREQVGTLIHVPNTWHMEAQGQWAQLLSERSFGGQAFFCNSGAEANEAAIKLARLHSPQGRYKIITFKGGFHGRTMATVTATAQPKYHEGIEPLLTTAEIAPSLRPGMHAATFGGNPIASRAGIATIEMIERDGLLENVQIVSEVFRTRLEALQQDCEIIQEVRVLGMMIGIELSIEGAGVLGSCMERNLLVNCTQSTVIRLLPAMNLTVEQAEEGCDILAEVLKEITS
ncbi:MAG: aminotransferase class III-fold pyridoxal phosphate-dependent enzyme [Planctomycetes bacterium]|nr:aminotransferase class III-fold pyridoxal phosphate-dependent enzyme [Planctomycetota bacterium]